MGIIRIDGNQGINSEIYYVVDFTNTQFYLLAADKISCFL